MSVRVPMRTSTVSPSSAFTTTADWDAAPRSARPSHHPPSEAAARIATTTARVRTMRTTVPAVWDIARPSRCGRADRHWREAQAELTEVDQANGTRFRPQLRVLAFQNRSKSLHAVYRHRENGRRTVVYEIVPRPPRFDGPVPLLGYIGESG